MLEFSLVAPRFCEEEEEEEEQLNFLSVLRIDRS